MFSESYHPLQVEPNRPDDSLFTALTAAKSVKRVFTPFRLPPFARSDLAETNLRIRRNEMAQQQS